MSSHTLTRFGRDERRAAILDIALQAFLAQGYAATSMSTIAARLGGSKGTLYNYFSSKEELFAAVIANRCEHLQSQLFDAEMEGDDLHRSLRTLGTRFLSVLLREIQIGLYRLVVAESEHFPEIGKAFYQAGPQAVRRNLGNCLERAIARGELKPCNPELMANYFFDLCMSGIHLRAVSNVRTDVEVDALERHALRATDIFFAAFSAGSAGVSPENFQESGN